MNPAYVVIIDIDGLRRDVFQALLTAGDLPYIEQIVGGAAGETACSVGALSTAPSITFAAQASIFTGQHPGRHGIAGNESFDRLGRISAGRPRHFAFDIGDTLAADDAVRVFTDGLASRFLSLEVPTLYETAAQYGWNSAVFYHMIARGANVWYPPGVVEIARFTKGKGRIGLEAGRYDAGMLDRLSAHLDADQSPRPRLLTAYFMGLDHHSHLHGPAAQPDYLRTVIDPQVGRLLSVLEHHHIRAETLFVLISDHGQVPAIPDDRHSIRLGFPFDRELSRFFEALGLDVHDFPGEDPACDAVVGMNGGLAHVYLQHRAGRWADPPRYAEDVLPVAEAFREMNRSGRYVPELAGCLDLILVRDAEHTGWSGEYRVYLGNGCTQPLADYVATHPALGYADPVSRIQQAASAVTGDLILLANGREGFYFGRSTRGVHGGLLPAESEVVFTLAYPGGSSDEIVHLRKVVTTEIADRCAAEGGRQPSVADLVPTLLALITSSSHLRRGL